MSTPIQVAKGDAEPPQRATHPIVVVLDRLRSAHNVGNIFRLAEICGAERVIGCGYTALPPHPKLVKTARGCDAVLPCSHAETSADAVRELKAQGYHVVGVETVAGAPTVWEAPLRYPLALVFGNEALGIAEETLPLCDGFMRLPVYGWKNSLNVANCAAVVLYEAVRRCPGADLAGLADGRIDAED